MVCRAQADHTSSYDHYPVVVAIRVFHDTNLQHRSSDYSKFSPLYQHIGNDGETIGETQE